MNHFHRVVFNRSLGARQVVPEIATASRGGNNEGSASSTARAPRLSLRACACLLAWCAAAHAQAASCDANSFSDLAICINTANIDTINLTGSITLDANLGVIGRYLTINGN